MFTLHVHVFVCVQCRCLPKCTFCNTCILNNINTGVIFIWSFLGWLVGWLGDLDVDTRGSELPGKTVCDKGPQKDL